MPKTPNSLTVDAEDWYHRPVLSKYIPAADRPAGTVEKGVEEILALLRSTQNRATFFFLGQVAELHPNLVERVLNDGHEVGCHGYSHKRLTKLDKAGFREELSRGSSAIRKAAQVSPVGHRAPNFSLSKKTGWAFDVLRELGYKYDSSIFPVMFSPNAQAPRGPYIADPAEPYKNATHGFVEVPLLTNSISGIRVPAAGGFYLRLFGPDFVAKSIRKANHSNLPATCYIHPWELTSPPSLRLPSHIKAFANFRIPCLEGLRSFVRRFRFIPQIEVLEKIGMA